MVEVKFCECPARAHAIEGGALHALSRYVIILDVRL